ncbi:MAG: hypothetical protein QOH93_2883 [Chloroflexia bacterium]|nr:hypothetical protein [Chloroflexia bacterium]
MTVSDTCGVDAKSSGKPAGKPSGRSRSVPASDVSRDLAGAGVGVGLAVAVGVFVGTRVEVARKGVMVGSGPRRVGADAPPSSQLSSVKPTTKTTVLQAKRKLLGEMYCTILPKDNKAGSEAQSPMGVIFGPICTRDADIGIICDNDS